VSGSLPPETHDANFSDEYGNFEWPDGILDARAEDVADAVRDGNRKAAASSPRGSLGMDKRGDLLVDDTLCGAVPTAREFPALSKPATSKTEQPGIPGVRPNEEQSINVLPNDEFSSAPLNPSTRLAKGPKGSVSSFVCGGADCVAAETAGIVLPTWPLL